MFTTEIFPYDIFDITVLICAAYLFSYFDCEVSSEWTRDSQDLLIWKFLEVQGGVLQVVLPWSIQVQLTFYPL